MLYYYCYAANVFFHFFNRYSYKNRFILPKYSLCSSNQLLLERSKWLYADVNERCAAKLSPLVSRKCKIAPSSLYTATLGKDTGKPNSCLVSHYMVRRSDRKISFVWYTRNSFWKTLAAFSPPFTMFSAQTAFKLLDKLMKAPAILVIMLSQNCPETHIDWKIFLEVFCGKHQFSSIDLLECRLG